MKRPVFANTVRLAAAALLVALAGCSRSAPGEATRSAQPIRVGAGEWMVAARDDSTAVLIRYPGAVASPGTRTPQQVADSAHTVVYHSSGGVSMADIDSLILPVSDSTGDVAPAFAIVEADALRLAVIPGRSPTLVSSPGKPDVHLFESVDGIWGIDVDLLPEPITSRRVGIYDYAQLRGRQREGEVILYWATAPIWSPSGEIVAFATNREAVYREEPGQSIWTIDLETEDEKPLVQEDGRSFRPVGWLGDEVVFIGDMPGVWAADLATGGRREIGSDAVFVDWARDGSAIAVAYGVPDSTRLEVIRQREGAGPERLDIPHPPRGFTYQADAIFSPDGNRLLLTVSSDSTEREHWIYDVNGESAAPIPSVGGRPTGRPAWVMDDAILVHVTNPETGLTEAWILPFDLPRDGAAARNGAESERAGVDASPMVLAVQPGVPGTIREHMQALVEGTLVLDEKCVRLVTHVESAGYLLVWPPGYTARERDRAILDDRGELLARIGDRVRLGGGEGARPSVPASASPAAPGECGGPFWVVGEVLRPALPDPA